METYTGTILNTVEICDFMEAQGHKVSEDAWFSSGGRVPVVIEHDMSNPVGVAELLDGELNSDINFVFNAEGLTKAVEDFYLTLSMTLHNSEECDSDTFEGFHIHALSLTRAKPSDKARKLKLFKKVVVHTPKDSAKIPTPEPSEDNENIKS